MIPEESTLPDRLHHDGYRDRKGKQSGLHFPLRVRADAIKVPLNFERDVTSYEEEKRH